MRSYRPSNHMSLGGFILLLLIALISGPILGGILFAIDHYVHFYLILLFPALAGGIAGGLLAIGVKRAKIRNPLMAGLTGIIAGLIIFGVYHIATYYIGFRNDVRSIYVEKNPGENPTDAELNTFIDKGLESEVGDTGFVGYLKFAAQTGFSVTSTTGSTDENPLEIIGTGAYIYWGVEILIAALLAAGLAFAAARDPFDEEANAWYGKPTVFALASTKSRKPIMKALKDGSFQEAGALMTEQPMKYPHLEIWTRRSPNAAAQDIMLIVNHMQRRNRPNKIKSGMVSAADLESLNRGITQASAANPVVSKA